MYTLKVNLKQHTPLIHFQHDQQGATLRATEVKPKLDRFIIENLLMEENVSFNFYENQKDGKQQFIHSLEAFKRKAANPENETQKKWASWLLGKGNSDHVALDYKMVIISGPSQQGYVFSSLPNSPRDSDRIENIMNNLTAEYINNTQHFADNEFIDKPDLHDSIKKGIMCETIQVRIFCLNKELQTIINRNYKSFFIITTFGTRQTKGFGCFLPEEIKDSEIIELVKKVPSVTGLFQRLTKETFDIKLQEINKTYSLLKRGQSFRGYQKSKLWEYLCDNQQLKWEKRKIKIHVKTFDPYLFDQLKKDPTVITHRIDDCKKATDDQNYKYIRALLGLSEQYEFALEIPGNKKMKVTIKDTLKDNSKTRDFAIDRFKSPIQFVITDNSVFLITRDIPELVHHWQDEHGKKIPRAYKFSIDKMKTNNSFTLEVPANFNLADFVEKKANFGSNLLNIKA